MRKDQLKQLESLQEKLIDVLLVEADPDNWPAAEKLPMDLTRDERGDRYWCKKNASASLSVLNKVMGIIHYKEKPTIQPGTGAAANEEIESEIIASEREASKILQAYWARHNQA